MSRRSKWAPRLLPEARRDAVGQAVAEASRLRGIVRGRVAALRQTGKLPAARVNAMERDLLASAESAEQYGSTLRAADLYWVTEPMARIALDASQLVTQACELVSAALDRRPDSDVMRLAVDSPSMLICEPSAATPMSSIAIPIAGGVILADRVMVWRRA